MAISATGTALLEQSLEAHVLLATTQITIELNASSRNEVTLIERAKNVAMMET